MTAERVLAALESGAMISMASRSTAAERRAIAQFVTGKSLSKKDVDTTPAPQSMCASAGNFTNPLTGPIWNGWGDNTFNTRYQDGPTAGLTAADVRRLKVKWAFGFPGDLDANAQPTIVGGRVFVGSQGGKVYSLSADTGCIHWFVPGDRRRARRGHDRPDRDRRRACLCGVFRRSERQRLRRQRHHRRAVVEGESRRAPARAHRRLAGLS